MLKRVMAVLACALALTGCESYADLTVDAFEPGEKMQSQFTLDDANCRAAAETARDFAAAPSDLDDGDWHAIFNGTYTACMAKRGYPRRDWSPQAPLPYSFDPPEI